MRIGIISEGHPDRAVISNILIGVLDIDLSDIVPLRPIYKKDETDKAVKDRRTFSSYSIIKEECESKELIDGFFSIEGQDFVVLHIDTAEADKYKVDRPSKNSNNYCERLRGNVIDKINSWLVADYSQKILYAVAIEEIDAWILCIYENRNSVSVVNAKERLNRLLSKKGVKYKNGPFEHYWNISRDFSNRKEMGKEKYIVNNCSLYLFVDEIKTKIAARQTRNDENGHPNAPA